MANRNYGDRGYEERNRDWGTGERGSMGWSPADEEQRGRDWGSGREVSGGRESDYGRDINWRSGQGGQSGSESQGGYWGQGQGRFGQSGQGGYENQGDYGNQGGYSGQGDRGSQGGYGVQGGYGSQGRGGSGNQGGYGGSQASQYGYSSGGGYTGQQSQPWQQGPHTGRGPQGYQRSNERIQEEVCEILTRHGQVDASGITVEVSNGEVTLTGTVNTRQEKRMAEECIESLSGVRDIHNQLRVAGRAGNGGGLAELSGEASGVQPSQSARGSSGETSKSRRRT